MSSLQNRVEAEFSSMKEYLDQQQAKVEQYHLRKIENSSYLCSAECTKDSSKDTATTRACVVNCMKPMEQVQGLFMKRQGLINQAIEGCMQKCEMSVKASAGENPTEAQMETARVDYMQCAVGCPKEVRPVIAQAFRDFESDLSAKKYQF